MDSEPLQTDDVNKSLYEAKHCNLFHTSSGTHVRVEMDHSDERVPWEISYDHREILDRPILERALALDFELKILTWVETGSRPQPIYRLTHRCFGIRAAAIKALQLVRILPGVPQDAWLFIASDDPEIYESPPPEPPSPWPPTMA